MTAFLRKVALSEILLQSLRSRIDGGNPESYKIRVKVIKMLKIISSEGG